MSNDKQLNVRISEDHEIKLRETSEKLGMSISMLRQVISRLELSSNSSNQPIILTGPVYINPTINNYSDHHNPCIIQDTQYEDQ